MLVDTENVAAMRRVVQVIGRLPARWGVLWSVPLTAAAAVTALATVWLDEVVVLGWDRSLSLTSARTLLATIGGTMVTATVVVFWIRGLLVSNRASRFPARVLEDYLRDGRQVRLMSFMVAVFVYAAMVVLSLPPPDSQDGRFQPVPTISVLTVTALTVVALLAIVRSVDTGVRYLNEHRILRSILEQGIAVIETGQPDDPREPPPSPPSPATESAPIRSTRTGWVHRIDDDALASALPEGTICHLHIGIGQFVTPATRLCHVATTGRHQDVGDLDTDEVENAIILGVTRSTRHDVSFAVRNLVDIAIAGLSAGGADRTTGREAILHLGALLRPLLARNGRANVHHDPDHDRWVVHDSPLDETAVIDETFEDLRHVGRDPLTARTILAVLDDLVDVAVRAGYDERADHLRRHARILVQQLDDGHLADADSGWVRQRASSITGREPDPD